MSGKDLRDMAYPPLVVLPIPMSRRRSYFSTMPHTDRLTLNRLTRALMVILPHMKVWIAPDGPRWKSEPIWGPKTPAADFLAIGP
jgi:hypothetical protein